MTKPTIGVIGVGLMGAGIAGCLMSAGYRVALLAHRNREPLKPLLARGALEAENARSLLQRSDILLTCVPNADVVTALAEELMPEFRAGHLWIDVTTSRPQTSQNIALALYSKGAAFADAPVTGGPQEASEGKLVSLIGCDEEYFAEVSAIAETYSKTVRRFGAPGAGHAAKLLNNLVTQGTMVLLSDAYNCASSLGVDRSALYDVMMSGAARSGSLEKAVGPALQGDFSGARFSIANAAKDLHYASDMFGQHAIDKQPLAQMLAARLDELVEQGRGNNFVSTMFDPTLNKAGAEQIHLENRKTE